MLSQQKFISKKTRFLERLYFILGDGSIDKMHALQADNSVSHRTPIEKPAVVPCIRETITEEVETGTILGFTYQMV